MPVGTSTVDGNLYVTGQIAAGGGITIPPGSVGTTSFSSNVAEALVATKQEHQHQKEFAQVHGSNATAERRVIHVVRGATGDLVELEIGNSLAATGDSTVTIDLYKNAASILSATVVLDSANTAYSGKESATFASTALVAGDVLSIVQTISAGTGTLPQGVFAQLTLREDAE